MKDFYQYLGLTPSASHNDVKTAYKKYAKYFLDKKTLDENEKKLCSKN